MDKYCAKSLKLLHNGVDDKNETFNKLVIGIFPNEVFLYISYPNSIIFMNDLSLSFYEQVFKYFKDSIILCHRNKYIYDILVQYTNSNWYKCWCFLRVSYESSINLNSILVNIADTYSGGENFKNGSWTGGLGLIDKKVWYN